MTQSSDPVIEIEGLGTRFGTQVIHEDLSLEIRRGEVMALVGGSGSGKSVLMNTIIGLIRQSSGTIRVFGEDTDTLSGGRHRELARRWGVLFQQGALFSSLTVAENVQVPLCEYTDLPSAMIDEITALKIAMSGLPAESCSRYPSELSGGMKKRAGLARALALDPEILFLDEPTAGLDPIGAAEFDDLIGELRTSLGLTVVMVTHDLDSLYAIADRIAVLVDRHVIVGTLDELQKHTHPWIRAYFHGPRARAAQNG